MPTKILAVAMALLCGQSGSPAPLAKSPQAATQGRQWLIVGVSGKWEVVERGKTHVMGKYEVLTSANKIRCTQSPCTLAYATPDGKSKPFPFPFGKPPALNTPVAVPVPPEPPVAPRPLEFQQLIGDAAVRGGRKKASPTCAGELALVAPSCGETIDVADFSVRWTPRPTEAGKLLTLFVASPDSSEKRRWTVKSDAGEFRDKTVEEHLRRLQLADRPADVTVRLMRSENVDVVRLVRLPSRADDAEYRRRIESASLLPDLQRRLIELKLALENGMWSRAAGTARELLKEAPDSVQIRQFALVGLCASDFADDIARLRGSLKDIGITGICDVEGPAR